MSKQYYSCTYRIRCKGGMTNCAKMSYSPTAKAGLVHRWTPLPLTMLVETATLTSGISSYSGMASAQMINSVFYSLGSHSRRLISDGLIRIHNLDCIVQSEVLLLQQFLPQIVSGVLYDFINYGYVSTFHFGFTERNFLCLLLHSRSKLLNGLTLFWTHGPKQKALKAIMVLG